MDFILLGPEKSLTGILATIRLRCYLRTTTGAISDTGISATTIGAAAANFHL